MYISVSSDDHQTPTMESLLKNLSERTKDYEEQRIAAQAEQR